MRLGNAVKVTGMGIGGVILFFVLVALTLFFSGLFWGWIIMLPFPLFSSTTISFATAFWPGVLAAFLIALFSRKR